MTSIARLVVPSRCRSPTQAIALLELDLERSFPMTNDTYGLTIELTRIADGDREALRAFAERGMALKAAPGAPSWTPTPAPIGTYQVDLSLTTRRWIGGRSPMVAGCRSQSALCHTTRHERCVADHPKHGTALLRLF